MVKRILRKYPPELEDAVVQLVLEQAQSSGDEWGGSFDVAKDCEILACDHLQSSSRVDVGRGY